jgi:hypothetical protein
LLCHQDETLINLTEAKERTLLTIATWLSSCPELALQYAAGKGIRQGLKDMYEATQGVSLASVQEVDQLVKGKPPSIRFPRVAIWTDHPFFVACAQNSSFAC